MLTNVAAVAAETPVATKTAAPEVPKTPAKSAATPSKSRDESPASSATPGSGKRGLRSKLKEKLHLGSGSKNA